MASIRTAGLAKNFGFGVDGNPGYGGDGSLQRDSGKADFCVHPRPGYRDLDTYLHHASGV